MSDLFDPLNPYARGLEVVIEDSPQALVAKLKELKTPYTILGFVQVGQRSAAYIMGDIRLKKTKKGSLKDGSSIKA